MLKYNLSSLNTKKEKQTLNTEVRKTTDIHNWAVSDIASVDGLNGGK